MYIDTQYEYKESVKREFFETEMRRTKETAVRAMSKVAHFEQTSLIKILAYSFLEGHEDAENLAYKLDLRKLDFLAVVENYDGFKDEYLKDLELAQNF